MQGQTQRLTYQRAQANADITRFAKAVAYPIGLFMLAMFVINRFNLFGVNIIAPLQELCGFADWLSLGSCLLIGPERSVRRISQ